MTHPGACQVRTARSRVARALLLGWVAFWLVSLAQPFCDAWAGTAHDGPTISAQATARAVHRGLDDPSDPCCAEATDAALEIRKAPDVAFLDRADGGDAPPRSVASPRRPLGAPDMPVARATPSPVDASPLYLRTLRLRI